MAAARKKAFLTGTFGNRRARYHHWGCMGWCCSKDIEGEHKKHETDAIKKEGSGERKTILLRESGYSWWILFHLEGIGKAAPLTRQHCLLQTIHKCSYLFNHSIKCISEPDFGSLQCHAPCVPHNIYTAQNQPLAVCRRAVTSRRKMPGTGNHMSWLQLFVKLQACYEAPGKTFSMCQVLQHD